MGAEVRPAHNLGELIVHAQMEEEATLGVADVRSSLNLGELKMHDYREVEAKEDEQGEEDTPAKSSHHLGKLKLRTPTLGLPGDVAIGVNTNTDPEMRAPTSLGKLKLPPRTTSVSVTCTDDEFGASYGQHGVTEEMDQFACPAGIVQPGAAVRPTLVGHHEGDVTYSLGQSGDDSEATRSGCPPSDVHRPAAVRPTLVGNSEADAAFMHNAQQQERVMGRRPKKPLRHKGSSPEVAPPAVASQALVDGATVMLWKGRRASQNSRS